ncbi:MAG: hypothetical protein U0R44_05765 [Candidatus Micrarchaeia archaeon]
MAQATRDRRTEEVNTDQLLALVRLLPRAVDASHPTRAATPESLSANLLKMNQVLDILRGSRPPESDARRQVYDEAVRLLGEGRGRDAAIEFLQAAMVGSINRLGEQMRQPGATAGAQRDALLRFLVRVDQGLGEGEANYAGFNGAGNTVTALIRVLRGGEATAAPRAEDQAAGRSALPLIEMPLRDMGPIHLLSSSSSESVVTINATTNPTVTSMFGGQDVAQGAMNALANAYATMANHPNDLAAQQAAARQLHDALARIPSNKEIWNGSVHPRFAAAMQALSMGNLQQGLSELSQETSFNAVFGALNNLYVVSVNQRSISILRGGVTVRYEFDRNVEAFTEFLRTAPRGEFQPRLLWMALGLYYERLLVTGELRQYAVQPGVSGTPGTIRQVSSQRIQGTGDVFSVTPQLALGASAWGNPMEIVFHCNLGYQSYDIGADVPTQGGGTQRVSGGQQGFYMGVWGVETRFPGREGQRSLIRMSRAGIGAVGDPRNFYASVSIEGNWMESNTLRIRSEVTPQFSYFLQQARVGLDVRPADFTHQVSPNWTLFYGPGFTWDQNLANGVSTLTGYGVFGFRFDRGVAIDLRGGVVGEVGGRPEERLPTTPFAGLNITITPQLWGGGGRQRPVVSDAVPRRERRRSDE